MMGLSKNLAHPLYFMTARLGFIAFYRLTYSPHSWQLRIDLPWINRKFRRASLTCYLLPNSCHSQYFFPLFISKCATRVVNGIVCFALQSKTTLQDFMRSKVKWQKA